MAKVLGIGGVFVKAADTAALEAWYQRVLGFEASEYGGAMWQSVVIRRRSMTLPDGSVRSLP